MGNLVFRCLLYESDDVTVPKVLIINNIYFNLDRKIKLQNIYKC